MIAEADGGRSTEPTDEEAAETAAEAAEGFVLSQYKQSRIIDMDVTVRFTDGTLDVDVYLNAPSEPDDPNPEEVAEGAVRVATEAVDELFAANEPKSGN
ncbi:DUF3194 domain-containing protein [Halobacteriales archaeon QH_6_64_20]|nr:MAG: DUF3194 domain-containing protein [Halobacteriales archaeon QH_6_64_20]